MEGLTNGVIPSTCAEDLAVQRRALLFLFTYGCVFPFFIVYFVGQPVTTVDLSYNSLQYILGFFLSENFASVAAKV